MSPEPLSTLSLEVAYRSDSDRLVQDFYVPCLQRSILYRRAVGYFTSWGLSHAAKGIAHLLSNGGQIRLVASPQLDLEDVRAIQDGYESKERTLLRAAARTFAQVEDVLVRDRLAALAWLVSEGALDVRLALRFSDGRPEMGLYHEKMGIFSDSFGSSVAFSGSPNETAGGLVENFEAVDVFWSWDDASGRVRRKIEDFERLWMNETAGLEVLEFSAETCVLLEPFKTPQRPARDPAEQPLEPIAVPSTAGAPSLPAEINLRDYQTNAIRSWFENNGRGIMKMATGSGKTITSLAAASKVYLAGKLAALIVVCPYRHLVTQWDRECQKFGLEPILALESRARWADLLSSALYNATSGSLKFLSVIVTNSTFASEAFQAKLRFFPLMTMLIADEVHNLGARKLRKSLPDGVPLRLGLSATPERWFDDHGTTELFAYFGPVLKPEYTLADALSDGVLVPYKYYPELVELTDDERDEYLRLSAAIAKAAASDDLDEDDQLLHNLLMQRARLIAVARNKLPALRALMLERLDTCQTLFYCGDGTMANEETDDIVRHVDAVSTLLGHELGYRVATYTAETSIDERESLRRRFESGDLQGLVAIRCLDEGVDIPSIERAFILASSSNPRQFIQRRGRILRICSTKREAEIFDMIVVPPVEGDISGAERSLVRKEIARVVEFASLARNAAEARIRLLPLQRKFGLMDV